METDEHLAKCIVSIDLNMVQAGVVRHPSEYRLSGFNKIQYPPKKCAVIDKMALLDLFSIDNQERFRQEHRHWVEAELQTDVKKRKGHWSESIAIGSEGFTKNRQQRLGVWAKDRSVISEKEGAALKEAPAPYNTVFEGKKSALRSHNS